MSTLRPSSCHSIINAAYEEWTVKRIRDSGTSTQMVHLPLELPQEMVQRRLLSIDGLSPSASASQSKKPPFALEEGSVLSYNTAFEFGQGIYHCWYPNSYWRQGHNAFLQADEDKEIAIVQGPDAHFAPGRYSAGYRVPHFDEDPFTPVLELTGCVINADNSERDTARRLIGSVDGRAGAMKSIEENEKRDENTWPHHLEKEVEDFYTLLAGTRKKSITISYQGGEGVYFVVRKWSPATAIAKRGD
ncbi:hypothetical protein THARTR1_02717 [Trichoderma harzianum]|uniref:Uncharacterized protein n=1 Tax=Trichoderma harzianum TaxID=5544 RepID=A0A2K0UHK3_TRIHA|nr:hypothetical protein THARTR1_02717 [Trichoderma harzianum]